MPTDFQITLVEAHADIQDVARLFKRYASSLPIDLGYQDFGSELTGLPGKYASPTGAILIARDQNRDAVGCVGLRPLSLPDHCEMKRLFTLPGMRGMGLGRALAQAAIEQARALGYIEMKLDSLPTMGAAIALYESLGFKVCIPYYAPTPAGTIFMTLRL